MFIAVKHSQYSYATFGPWYDLLNWVNSVNVIQGKLKYFYYFAEKGKIKKHQTNITINFSKEQKVWTHV